MKKTTVLFLFLLIPVLLSPSEGDDLFHEGLTHFDNGELTEAYRKFTRLAEEESFYYYRANAVFWQSKTLYMMGAYIKSRELLNQYLINWTDNTYYEEAEYLLAKTYYQQKEYQTALDLFLDFSSEYANSDLMPHALYWTAETLYQLGHLDEARIVYDRLIRDYPTSTKVEASRYRFSLIEIKEREEKLLDLLKWSHEEFLDRGQEMAQTKLIYEEALKAYQNRIIALTGDDRQSAETAKLLTLMARALDLKEFYLNQKEGLNDED